MLTDLNKVTSDTGPKTLVICVCTYQRPADLTALFASFENLKTEPEFGVSIVVIDNDVEPTSRALVTELALGLPWPVKYVHEPEPGIPSARNRAIIEAGETGHMVFVDDDETVDPDWLIELVKVGEATNATFVQGPVLMLVEQENDAWWLESLLFKQKTFPDQSARDESWTNNVMIDLSFLSRTGCRFDEKLRFDGGSDTLFFQDIVRNGGTGAYAAHAYVSEIQPKKRLSWNWAIQRQYRYGTTRANTVIMRQSRVKAVTYCMIRSAGMFVVGGGHLLSSVFRGKMGLANGIAFIARGAGVFMGAFGVRKLEYAR